MPSSPSIYSYQTAVFAFAWTRLVAHTQHSVHACTLSDSGEQGMGTGILFIWGMLG